MLYCNLSASFQSGLNSWRKDRGTTERGSRKRHRRQASCRMDVHKNSSLKTRGISPSLSTLSNPKTVKQSIKPANCSGGTRAKKDEGGLTSSVEFFQIDTCPHKAFALLWEGGGAKHLCTDPSKLKNSKRKISRTVAL